MIHNGRGATKGQQLSSVTISRVDYSKATKTRSITVGEVIEQWRCDNWKELIINVREVYREAFDRGGFEEGKKASAATKAVLACAMFDGVFRSRARPVIEKWANPSGIFCSDFDNLDQALAVTGASP